MSSVTAGEHDWQIVVALLLSTHPVPPSDAFGKRARTEAWTIRARERADFNCSRLDSQLWIKEGTASRLPAVSAALRSLMTSSLGSADTGSRSVNAEQERALTRVPPRHDRDDVFVERAHRDRLDHIGVDPGVARRGRLDRLVRRLGFLAEEHCLVLAVQAVSSEPVSGVWRPEFPVKQGKNREF